MEAQLSLRNVAKRFEKGGGVDEFSLDVKEGELVTLLGPSGCGKTTTLRMIGGFMSPDSGDIRIGGKSVLLLPPEKRPTAMVFQSYNLWPHMNVYENLAFGLKIRRQSKNAIRQSIGKMLELVRLPGVEKKLPGELSGGQQQRIALARALLLQPEVLLLDEPFSALDAKLRMEMREELREIQSSTGVTMIFVTHDQEEALSISDRVVVMNDGRVEQIGTPKEVYDAPNNLFVARFIGRMNFLKRMALGDTLYRERWPVSAHPRPQGEWVIASRPEDVCIHPPNEPGLTGKVKQVMALGHYVEASVETECGSVKVFLDRDDASQWQSGDAVSLEFRRELWFDAATERNIFDGEAILCAK